jgi:hypothetical protein
MGCALWVLLAILVLLAVSLVFGGFQLGTRSGSPVPHVLHVPAAPTDSVSPLIIRALQPHLSGGGGVRDQIAAQVR